MGSLEIYFFKCALVFCCVCMTVCMYVCMNEYIEDVGSPGTGGLDS